MTTLLNKANPAVLSLSPYQPGKPIEELERELGITNIIKMASNENPLGPSSIAVRAMQKALPELWLYPDGGGFALKAKLAAQHGVEASQITLGNGSSDPLEFVVRAFVKPGDEVLFSQHSFAMYPLVTRAAGGVGVAAPAKNWGYDLDALAAHINDKTKLIFIANPNNPTGTWLRSGELESFIAQVPEHIMVVVDEAYFDYATHPETGGNGYPDAMQWLERFPNLMVARTFSKSHALAGLRVGYSVSSPEVADLMNRVRPPFNVNSMALVAAEASLGDTEHLSKSVQMNTKGLRFLSQGFENMGLDYIPSVGNFISVRVGANAMAVYDALLRAGIIVRPVANYEMPEHLRVTVGLPHENERFLESLKGILKESA